MKSYKIKQSEYGDLPALLERLGLVNKEEGTAHPNRTFISKQTEKLFKTALHKQAVKTHGKNSKAVRIAAIVGMEWLNLGPVVIGKGIETGYVLVTDG